MAIQLVGSVRVVPIGRNVMGNGTNSFDITPADPISTTYLLKIPPDPICWSEHLFSLIIFQ